MQLKLLTISSTNPFYSLRDIWLCHICAEIREMWKKTGAWFYKSLPNYKCTPQPLRSSMHELRSPPEPPSPTVRPKPYSIRVVDSSSEEENDDVIDGGPRGRSQSNATKRHSPPLQRLNSLRLHGTGASGTTPNEDGFFFRKLSSTLSLFSRQQSNMHNDQNASSSNDLSSSGHMKIHDDRRRSSRCNSESSSYSVSEASVAGESLLGPGQTYREPPLGWLELRLVYNAVQKTLDCTLFRARDLPAIDIICLPDPYARLNIVSEWGQLKQDKWLQSKIVAKTRSPEFNETIRFGGVEADELQGGVLYVVLLDEDKFGSDFLGAGRVQLKVVSVLAAFAISKHFLFANTHKTRNIPCFLQNLPRNSYFLLFFNRISYKIYFLGISSIKNTPKIHQSSLLARKKYEKYDFLGIFGENDEKHHFSGVFFNGKYRKIQLWMRLLKNNS